MRKKQGETTNMTVNQKNTKGGKLEDDI
jgi:hypothetical protein